jgi:NAD(P)-dependent dehydrogenase (short-subunit alcohol dehydrogenase family)
VAITGRSADRGQAALRQLEPHAGDADMVMFRSADVTEEDQVVELIDGVERRFGALHIAVNGAANVEGAAGSGAAFTDMSLQAFESVVRAALR